MKKYLILILSILSTIVLAACSKTDTGKTTVFNTTSGVNITTSNALTTSQAVTTQGTMTEYVDVPLAPTYDEVDTSTYTTYYFSTGGNDSSDGLSPKSAKQSLKEFMSIVSSVKEPTQFLFKKGDTFDGEVNIKGFKSEEDTPLIISSYGEGDDMPKFTVSEPGDRIITIEGENVRISNLEVYGVNRTCGIAVIASKPGASKNIVVENNYIHDICFNWTSEESIEDAAWHMNDYDTTQVCPNGKYAYSTTAIYFSATEGNKVDPVWFENIWVMNNTIRTIGRCGIITDSRWQSGDGCGWNGLNKYISQDNGWYPPKNVVISGNDIRYIGGDAIVTIGAEDCWIEHNTALHTALLGRYGYACAAIWPVCARRVYMQWNEAGYCRLINGCTDGEGFDIDIGCSEIYFQYNYSHDNDGGGLLICNVHSQMPLYDEKGNPVYDENGKQMTFDDRGNWNNAYIRNNVFVNNGEKGSNPSLMVMSSDCENIYVENNTIILNTEITSQLLFGSYDFGQCGQQKNLVFRNNIVYVEEPTYARIELDNVSDYLFENNIFYNFPDSFFSKYTGVVDKNPIRNVNPKITVPEDRDGYDKISEYKAMNDKVYQLGISLSLMAKYDASGTLAEGIKYIGAFASK